MGERVAITGLGVLTSAGNGKEALIQALSNGHVPFVTEESAPGVHCQVGRVGEFVPTSVRLQSSKASQIDAVSRYAVETCAQALQETGAELTDELKDRTGVLLGTAFGCFESNVLFDQYYRNEDGRMMNVSPMYFKSTVANAAAGWASILLKLRGPNATFVSGRIAGAEAVAHGYDLIQDGSSDLILAGGFDRVLPMNLLLDPLPEGIASEGAGIVALESMSRAVARGAKVYGRLQGYHRQAISGADELPLLEASLEALGIRRSQVGAIVSARSSDAALQQLRQSLSTHTHVPEVWPLKQTLGESYGAWAGHALVAACLKLEQLPAHTPTVLICHLEPDQEGIVLALRKP